MRRSAALAVAVLVFAASAFAEDPNLGRHRPEKPANDGTYSGGGRIGGDTVNDAVVIAALPFSDTGGSCGFSNDYDAVCPYDGSTAPDAVYRYAPDADVTIAADLCASSYDTKIYVCQDTPGGIIACNDDAGCGYSGWQSFLGGIRLSSGHTYYIVVDGYGASCGEYRLGVRLEPECELTCPPGALVEREPPCVDQYYDGYNSGCGGFGWIPVAPQQGDCATLCGRSCTFLYHGLSYRDTDWYWANAAGGTMTMGGIGEFPLQIILMHGTNCANIQYVLGWAPRCERAEVSWTCSPGQEVWLWAAPAVFSGVPESDYLLDVCGVGPLVTYIGACCDSVDGACSIRPPGECIGFWYGPGSTCSPNPCLYAGACCLISGECVLRNAPDCAGQGGDYRGHDSTCSPNPCPDPSPVERMSWGQVKQRFR